MTQVLKNKKGVTLVELLAVIVIMGIIAAIAVPAIGGLIENTRKNAAIAQLDQMVEAANLYALNAEDAEDVLVSVLGLDVSITGITFDVVDNEATDFTLTDAKIVFNDVTYTVTGTPGNWQVS